MNDYLAGYQILCQQLSPSVFWRYNSIIFGFHYFWFKDSCPYYFCSFLSFSRLATFRILYFISRYFTVLCLSLVSGVLAIFCCASSFWICLSGFVNCAGFLLYFQISFLILFLLTLSNSNCTGIRPCNCASRGFDNISVCSKILFVSLCFCLYICL